MDRRQWIALTAGAAAALPRLAFAHPDESASLVSEMADWKPRFFNAEQNQTVVALTEAIIPEPTPPARKRPWSIATSTCFSTTAPDPSRSVSLTASAASKQPPKAAFSTPFRSLEFDQQTALLSEMDSNPIADDELRRFFHLAKSLTGRIYYNTEVGYQELDKHHHPHDFACHHDGGTHV